MLKRDGTGHVSRQSQEKADGVTPAGFFSGTYPQCSTPILVLQARFLCDRRRRFIFAAIFYRASGCECVGACGCALACDDAGFGTGFRVPVATCACGADVLGRGFC